MNVERFVGFYEFTWINTTMRCPFCSAKDTRVIDSRLSNDGDQVRRRRQCVECKERFTTYEIAELNLPRVVKSDGRRESFDEAKLRNGILRALEKRPVDTEKIESIVDQTKRRLLASGEREIASREIGESVMESLAKVDHVAYIRFASVYRSFQDVEEFRAVVDRLKKDPPSSSA